MDEQGLLVGIRRIPGETNQEFRQRLLGRPRYDSTKQGLINWISNGLLQADYNVLAPTVFSSLRDPLSSAEYQLIEDPAVDYYSPRGIIEGTTWTIIATSDTEKDEITVDGITWTLWKQPDGSYDQIWTTTSAPTENVEIRYLWRDPGDQLYVVRETPTLLSWVDGNIEEIDPDETT